VTLDSPVILWAVLLVVAAWVLFITAYEQDRETLEFTLRKWVRAVLAWFK
jgi:hypothetical protein